MEMENYGNFHTQLVSIVEVLANTAVLEICKLVDDDFTHLRLEVSRTQRENLELKNKLRLMEVGAPVQPSCSAKGYSTGPLVDQGEGLGGETDLLEEKPVVVIKAEKLEVELTGSIMGECQLELPASGTVVDCPSFAHASAGVGGKGGCHARPGLEFLPSDPGSAHASQSEWASSSPCVADATAGLQTPAAEGSPSLDSFHDLFASPDVAQVLSSPGLWEGGGEERLAPSFSVPPSSVPPPSPATASDGHGHRGAPPPAGARLSTAEPPTPPHAHPGPLHRPLLHLHPLPAQRPRPPSGQQSFGCSVCGKHFSQSSHIKRHMSVHTGARPFACSVCGKRFSQACSLKVHQAVHTGAQPYGCSQCGKSFSLLGNLVRHQAVHTGSQPYGCSQCGKSFSLLGNLVRHQALHFRTDPQPDHAAPTHH